MKHTGVASLALVFVLCVAGGWAWAEIEGSKHDFSKQEWSGGDKCGVCHAPHKVMPPTTGPEWDPKADVQRTFGKPVSDSEMPGNGTLVCIRCHDGTIAKDAVGGTKKQRFANIHHPARVSSAHGTTDHPVGIEYPQFKEGYHPPLLVTARGNVPLPEGKVECVSCHDPHDMSEVRYMLIKSNARSALCLTCHKK
ncbi:MAG: cytochrome c3 family protein [Phycisphaerales bacterium]|nr:MAG: cytochrome c3 family protein [Phycisphaerales bacterium]